MSIASSDSRVCPDVETMTGSSTTAGSQHQPFSEERRGHTWDRGLWIIRLDRSNHCVDQLSAVEHPRLDSFWGYVGPAGIDLLLEDVWLHALHGFHAFRVLRGDGRDRARSCSLSLSASCRSQEKSLQTVASQRSECLEISLDPCSACECHSSAQRALKVAIAALTA